MPQCQALRVLVSRWNVNDAHLAVDHGLNLKGGTEVSGVCMNRVYDLLRTESNQTLGSMWDKVDPYTPAGGLLRHQIAYVMLKRREGRWLPATEEVSSCS